MKKPGKIEFRCRCVIGEDCDSLIIQHLGDGDIMFDVWSGKKVHGVVLNKEDAGKLIKFLQAYKNAK
jgi:hypothetical protein